MELLAEWVENKEEKRNVHARNDAGCTMKSTEEEKEHEGEGKNKRKRTGTDDIPKKEERKRRERVRMCVHYTTT